MAAATISSPGRMTHIERLLKLFQAFRDRNDDDFERAAAAIISDELAANHHAQARELQKALYRNGEERPTTRPLNGLAVLPKDRRHGEPLVNLVEPLLHSKQPLFSLENQPQVERVIQEHTQRAKLRKFGYTPKNKLLFWGPPGCGKTLTAHWLAHELRLPLGIVRLNTLITSYLGETAAHLQRVFDLAEQKPMVLLLDEADAVAKERDDSQDVGELKRIVNSLLQALDTFRSHESLLIAASNHQYLLDQAMWRRFDDVVHFPLPNSQQSKSYIQWLISGVSFSGNLEQVVKKSQGLSFAQIEREVVEAIKSMILADRTELSATELSAQFKRYQFTLKAAQSTRPRKNTTHE